MMRSHGPAAAEGMLWRRTPHGRPAGHESGEDHVEVYLEERRPAAGAPPGAVPQLVYASPDPAGGLPARFGSSVSLGAASEAASDVSGAPSSRWPRRPLPSSSLLPPSPLLPFPMEGGF